MAETKIKQALEAKKAAIGELEDAETIEQLEAEAAEMGWEFELGDDFDAPAQATPKVKLIRKSTVGDSIRAEDLARREFNVPDGKSPTIQQITVAKMALLCKFDGEHWNVDKIGELGADFFGHILLRWGRYMS